MCVRDGQGFSLSLNLDFGTQTDKSESEKGHAMKTRFVSWHIVAKDMTKANEACFVQLFSFRPIHSEKWK